jgi:hypothetical protein
MTADNIALSSAYAAWATAFFTCVISLSVFLTAAQLRDQRKMTRIAQTPDLIREWGSGNLPAVRALLDKNSDLERNRRRANAVFKRTRHSKRTTTFGRLRLEGSAFVHRQARAAERMEVYVRRGAADEGIIAEHLGYGIVMSYYTLQDVLKVLAAEENRDYEGWRVLAVRCQRYAKLHPRYTNLFRELIWAELPLISYSHRDPIGEPAASWWSRLRLRWMKKPS